MKSKAYRLKRKKRSSDELNERFEALDFAAVVLDPGLEFLIARILFKLIIPELQLKPLQGKLVLYGLLFLVFTVCFHDLLRLYGIMSSLN